MANMSQKMFNIINCRGLNVAHKCFYVLISGTCQCYLTWQKGLPKCNLRWDDYLGGFYMSYKREAGMSKEEEVHGSRERLEGNILLALEMEKGAMSEGMQGRIHCIWDAIYHRIRYKII